MLVNLPGKAWPWPRQCHSQLPRQVWENIGTPLMCTKRATPPPCHVPLCALQAWPAVLPRHIKQPSLQQRERHNTTQRCSSAPPRHRPWQAWQPRLCPRIPAGAGTVRHGGKHPAQHVGRRRGCGANTVRGRQQAAAQHTQLRWLRTPGGGPWGGRGWATRHGRCSCCCCCC
jgi:hypothetical protein